MYKSKLEINGAGEKYLKVFYDKITDDFNEAIKTALTKHDVIRGRIPILCLPINTRWQTWVDPGHVPLLPRGQPYPASRGQAAWMACAEITKKEERKWDVLVLCARNVESK